MGVNLEDVLGTKNQDILVDKSKRTMNILLIGVAILVVIILIIIFNMFNKVRIDNILNKAAMITRDAEKISGAITARYIKSKQDKNESLIIGEPQDQALEDKIVRLTCGGNDLQFKYGYYYLTEQEINTIISEAGLSNLEYPHDYVVNYSTGEVISLEPVRWDNKDYYEVQDLSAIARKREDPNAQIPCDHTVTINRPEDMQALANYPDAIFRLNNDIDMESFKGSNGWKPIPHFSGQFYGRGYKIYNLTIQDSSQGYSGLFGSIEASAYIENLVLEGVNVTGGDYVGAIAGSCNGTIKNCTVTGNVYSTGRYVGGIFGNFEGIASAIKSSVNVTGGEYVGGFAGQITGGSITQCNASNITITGNQDSVGGFAGLVQSNRDLELSQVSAISTIQGTTERIGGLVGWINASNSSNKLSINNSYAQGIISRGRKAIGGFVGELSSDSRSNISLAYNVATCKADDPLIRDENVQLVGGFAGNVSAQSQPSIVYCFWERDFNLQSLPENGVGSTGNGLIKFDPLTPEAIVLPNSFNGWTPDVFKIWYFDNRNAPTLSWEH